MKELTRRDKDTIVYMVTKEYRPVSIIAQIFRRSRQTIYTVLKNRKVKIRDYAFITVTCDYCGKEFSKRRYAIRDSKKDFCCLDHWLSYRREKWEKIKQGVTEEKMS